MFAFWVRETFLFAVHSTYITLNVLCCIPGIAARPCVAQQFLDLDLSQRWLQLVTAKQQQCVVLAG